MRTFDENREAINQLWPTHEWTDEERKLAREDLSPLNQSMLYDAIRNAKRKHDTPFVHLKWLLDEYRDLESAKKRALNTRRPTEPKLKVNVNDEADRKMREDFIAWIDACEPKDFGSVEQTVLDKLGEMHAKSAVRVLAYARSRLLGEESQFGKVMNDGSIAPISLTKGVA